MGLISRPFLSFNAAQQRHTFSVETIEYSEWECVASLHSDSRSLFSLTLKRRRMAEDTSGKNRGLFWVAIVGVSLITILVGLNIYLLLRDDADTASVAVEQQDAPDRSDNPIFVRIDPFTVNLQGDQLANRLLYVGISLQVGNDETRDFLLEHMPQVRSRLLILHSVQSPAGLATLEGKENLVQGILNTLSEPMSNKQPQLLIDDVLFTEFIVQ